MISPQQHDERLETAFNFICRYEQMEGYSPTIREVQEHLGLSSSSTAHEIVKELISEGRIENKGRCPRTIKVKRGKELR